MGFPKAHFRRAVSFFGKIEQGDSLICVIVVGTLGRRLPLAPRPIMLLSDHGTVIWQYTRRRG